MKIKGTCRRCGREFLAEQVILNGGHCPWDGKPFQADYAVVLVDSLTDAESAGSTLENALEKLADIEPEFVLDDRVGARGDPRAPRAARAPARRDVRA